MKVALAQIRVKTGDIAGNERRIMDALKRAPDEADVILFPEMCVSGYNCGEDFEYEDFVLDCQASVERIAAVVPEGKLVLIGGPRFADEKYDDSGNLRLHNSAFALRGGKVAAVYDKHILANDYHHEDRKYFVPGDNRLILSHGPNNERVAVFICEDVWHEEWVNHVLERSEVDHVLVLNFSYFSYDKLPVRHALAKRIADKHDVSVYYCNAFGVGDISKDILVYDGYSFAVLQDSLGHTVEQMPGYCESIQLAGRMSLLEDIAVLTKWTQIHQAAIHAVRWMYEESGLT
jgi:NAD+ synthase (glutamine-hydrolysing)